MQKIVRQEKSLTKIAYEKIKAAICDSQIKQGELLSENLIAKELEMSRTPVREALRMLAMEDYVEIKNGVGIYVKMISYKDIRDIFEVRRSLEILAARTSIYEITNEDVRQLEEKFSDLLRKVEDGSLPDTREFTNLDWELHELIVERCRNNYVKNIMESINSNIKRYQYMSCEALGSIRESTEQHLGLLEYIKKKDVPGLQAALDRHIDWSIGCLLNRV